MVDSVGLGFKENVKGVSCPRNLQERTQGQKGDVGGVIGVSPSSPKSKTSSMWSTRVLMSQFKTYFFGLVLKFLIKAQVK